MNFNLFSYNFDLLDFGLLYKTILNLKFFIFILTNSLLFIILINLLKFFILNLKHKLFK